MFVLLLLSFDFLYHEVKALLNAKCKATLVKEKSNLDSWKSINNTLVSDLKETPVTCNLSNLRRWRRQIQCTLFK